MSLLLSRRDLDFLLYQWLHVETLTERPRFADHARETFDAALDAAEKIAQEQFAPHNKKADQQEPWFDGERVHLIPEQKVALDAFSAAGFMAASQDAELGGMQLPHVLEQACHAYFFSANVATSAYVLLTIGNASAVLTHGSPQQIDAFAKPAFEGRFFGTMCLSEPQAGSSLADIRTRAEPDGDSAFGPRYRLFGNKMWISAGEHDHAENIVHLVLAKIPGEDGKPIPGVKGISLFIVPKKLVAADGKVGERNDIALAGLNHKMGYRGTTNCLLNFGEGSFRPEGKAGAIGYRIGNAHQGLAYMFHMMNGARIGVGLGATMLGYTGYLHALEYARGRPQGRAATAKDPASSQINIIEHTDVRRMLLAQKSYVEGALALNLYCARLLDEEKTATETTARKHATLLLDILTPIAKSWPSQWCLAANDLAIQVHGGYGYTRDYNVEQFYRDNRLNPIHEGTHGIQALDLLGRKLVMQEGAALHALGGILQHSIRTAASIANAEVNAFAHELSTRLHTLVDVTKQLHGSGDIGRTLANATVYLEAFGHIVMAWIWLEQATIAAQAMASATPEDLAFYHGKLQAARYFQRWELPKVDAQLALLATLDTTTLDMQNHWF